MPRVSISPIKVGQLSFLILDCPSDTTLPAYLPVLEDHSVTDVVRICEGSPYDPKPLTDLNIQVHDNMKFQDGTAPGKDVVARWLELNDEVFFNSAGRERSIAVHCVSGIGRAPVLVAISLVEGGMDPLDAIAYIRKVRRGALNRSQIAFLDSYKKRKQGFGSSKKTSSSKGNGTLGSTPTSSTAASKGLSNPSDKASESGPQIEKKKSGFISKMFGKK
ncbi:protein tyrosine phosphatase type IVA [Entomortierella parvispora]|uniref:Protein tyrosine phosphatase type IVA 3 n=1 Tax=Entomortierella parvispora TaxID=205924 RepID=A0A9P3LS83_9FUNG|nr:protein tyrosine phosphatase type IVA [Entomortierella parvispora]